MIALLFFIIALLAFVTGFMVGIINSDKIVKYFVRKEKKMKMNKDDLKKFVGEE